jgi:hypothetical protein
MNSPPNLLTEQEENMANVSYVMGTKDQTDGVYRSSHGKTFQNVAVSEAMLADKLLANRVFDTSSIKPVGAGIDMSTVMKPIRGAEELEQILRTEESSVARVSEEGRLQYEKVLTKITHSSKLQKLQEQRKAEHDEAFKIYEKSVNEIAEELEEQVIEQCRLLRDDELIEIDLVIKQELNQLSTAAVVQQMNHDEVKKIWTNTNQYLIQRKEYVENYAQFLMNIETDRSQRTGRALLTLAESMIAIGYILRDECIRIVESKTFFINEIIITNTKAFEDIIARMRRLHVDEVVRCRCQWAKYEYEWRQLRHQRAIREFHQSKLVVCVICCVLYFF